MARPSVKAERTEEILDAFERCVARLGIEGTTLERIAEESGLRRSLLRYHVGNRDTLVQALATRYIAASRQAVERLIEAMPAQHKTEWLINYLFEHADEERTRLVLVASALVGAADLYPDIKQPMLNWCLTCTHILSDIIASDYPAASQRELESVAWGLASLLHATLSTTPLEPGSQFLRASHRAASRLVASLEADTATVAPTPRREVPEPA